MGWDDLKAQWAAVQAGWPADWAAAQAQAIAAIDTTAADAGDTVRAFLQALDDIDQDLTWMRTRIDSLEPAERAAWLDRLLAWRKAWTWLGAGIYPYVSTESGSGVQGPPVAVLVIGAAGIAWAVAFWTYAQSLRDEVALAVDELAARERAREAGETLQDSTLPKPPPGGNEGGLGTALGVLAGLGLLGGAVWLVSR